MQLIRNFVEADIAGGKKMERGAARAARWTRPATQDIRSVQLWPTIKERSGHRQVPQLQEAIAKLDAWYADGGHRRDLNNTSISSPGTYQHNDAITIMDAWWPKLLAGRVPSGARRHGLRRAARACSRSGRPNPGREPAAPDFADGWYGYVSKDLRDVFAANGAGTTPRGAYSKLYCGGGSLEVCRAALQSSLSEAAVGHAAADLRPRRMRGRPAGELL